MADHLSDYLFVPVDNAGINLVKEGISQNIYQVGDIMLDAFNHYSRVLAEKFPDRLTDILKREDIPSGFVEEGFFLLTIHRAENTDDPEKLSEIISALNSTGKNALFPVHPRTTKILNNLNIQFGKQIRLIEPLGYFDMLALEKACDFIVTDSGGVQKEAYFAQKPCITLRDQTEWMETVDSGWNTLTGTNPELIFNACQHLQRPENHLAFYGKGDASHLILSCLSKHLHG